MKYPRRGTHSRTLGSCEKHKSFGFVDKLSVKESFSLIMSFLT